MRTVKTLCLFLWLAVLGSSYAQKQEWFEFRGERYRVVPEEYEYEMKSPIWEGDPNLFPDGLWVMVREGDSPPDRVGRLKNGKKEGTWTAFLESGAIWWKREYRGGRLHGKVYLNYSETGTREIITEYSEGVKEGWSVSWWTSDQVRDSIHYEQGKRNGKFRAFARNGQPLLKGAYLFGCPVQTWTEWDAVGNKISQKLYLENFPEDSVQYYSAPQVFIKIGEITVEIGDPTANGIWTFWDTNGNIIREMAYRNGILESTTNYWKNGRLKSTGECLGVINSLPHFGKTESEFRHGVWKYWDIDGKLMKEEKYEKNELISSKKGK